MTGNKESHVDLVTAEDDKSGGVVLICHLDLVMAWTWLYSPTNGAVMAFAAHHLNIGDGRLVPEVEGLSDCCHICFTLEATDTKADQAHALDLIKEYTVRQADVNYMTSYPAPYPVVGDAFA